MTLVAGVDGCRGGWVVAAAPASAVNDAEVFTVPNLAALLAARPAVATIAIDVPIGLSDAAAPGGRACDRAARRRLGPGRGPSVFPAPIRAVLGCASFAEACAVSRCSSAAGVGLTLQCWNITPKIREVEDLLRREAALRGVLFEAHPEVSFAAMNARRAMTQRKVRVAGREERIGVLRRAGVEGAARWVERPHRPPGAAPDDVLDAVACLWTASRIALGEAEHLPEGPPRLDAAGLPMRIWC